MYCQSCGAESSEALRYCKRCGSILNAADGQVEVPVSPPRLLGIVFVLALLTFGCMAAILGFVGAEAHELDGRALSMITIFGFATIFGVDALLIRFLTTMFHLPSTRVLVDRTKELPANRAIPQPRVPALEPGLTGMPSVTEHTTRSFERPGTKSTY